MIFSKFPIQGACWNLFIGLIGVFALFTLSVLTSQHQLIEIKRNVSQLCSLDIQFAGFALLGSSLPMLMELFAHVFSKKLFQKGCHLLNGRTYYTLATISLGLQLSFQYSWFLKSYESTFYLFLGIYRIMFIASIMFFVAVTDNTRKNIYSTIMINIFNCVYVYVHTPSLATFYVLKYFTTVLMLSAVSVFVIYENIQILKNHLSYSYSYFLYVNFIFIIAFFGDVLRMILFCLFFRSDTFSYYDGLPTFSVYLYVVVTSFLMVVPSLIANDEAFGYKDQIIATKTSYERYIAHEMRSPMNGVHMGIQYCIKSIAAVAKHPETENIRNALLEVKQSCEDGLVILDDLLLYDKFENGTVSLQKVDVNVKSSIYDYLDMFNIQFQAKQIKYQVLNCANVGGLMNFDDKKAHGLMTYNINDKLIGSEMSTAVFTNIETRNSDTFTSEYVGDDDTVHVDKAKWGQVLRNVMSNAIKFTPNKGSITMYVTFVPKTKCEPTTNDVKFSMFNSFYDKLNKAHIINYLFRNTTSAILPPVEQKNLLTKEKEQEQLSSDSLVAEKTKTPLTRRRRKSTSQKIDIASIDTLSSSMSPIETTTSGVLNNEPITQTGILVIEVRDSGVGVSLENQSRLFKEVVQFNPDKLQAGGGSGLGMSISKSIVDMHGGRISVHSEGEGKGTTFRIEIPMTRNSRPNVTQPAAPPIITKKARKKANELAEITEPLKIKKRRILIVDDVGSNRKFLRKLLELRGHECEEAEDGSIALTMVKATVNTKREYYDIILMDFVMPNLNGPDATREIRQLGFTGSIIGVTGNALNEDITYFINSGADNVIVKPLRMPVLTEMVDV